MYCYQSAAAAREDGSRALAHARKLEDEHSQKLNKIQNELLTLRAKEKQIAEVRHSVLTCSAEIL